MGKWSSQLHHFGMIGARSLAQAAGDRVPQEEKTVEDYRRKEAADICLNCTKPECSGTAECFKRRRKELGCSDGE